MHAVIKGIFQEGKFAKKKDGSQEPYILVYGDEEITKINGVDFSGLHPGMALEIPVSIRLGSYGLYIKAVAPDDEEQAPPPVQKPPVTYNPVAQPKDGGKK